MKNRPESNRFFWANGKILILLVPFLCLTGTAPAGKSPAVQWGHQLVTPTNDSIFRTMVADSNDNIYIAVSRRARDAPDSTPRNQFLLKLNQDGVQLWNRLIADNTGTDSPETVVQGLAADNRENIYVFGYTNGKLGPEKIGGYDAFVARYDHAGTRQQVWQIGTTEHDVCTGLDIDASGNVYLSGYTYGSFAGPNKGHADIFIAAYNQTDTLIWKEQSGTSADDRTTDLCLGNNNDLYICGSTNGALAAQSNGYSDFVTARYERTGKLLWLHQYGTPANDGVVCMVTNEHGHVYVGGITYGDFAFRNAQRGRGDAFVARIAETGELLWKRQFGSNRWDQTWDMAAFRDGTGDILASGCQIPSGICQGFCRRYSPEGKLIWIKEFRERSPGGGTCGRTVAIDSDNNCYHAGVTHANQFGINNDTGNIYIVRFDGMPDKTKNAESDR